MPAESDPDLELEETQNRSEAKAGLRPVVVVIDDDEFSLKGLAAVLEHAGLVVYAESGGDAGIRTILRVRPDVVVTDLDMPDVNGVEVAARVRGMRPDGPRRLIAVTGLSQFRDVSAFDAVLRKPVEPRALLEAIR